jgi:hypothetical protein
MKKPNQLLALAGAAVLLLAGVSQVSAQQNQQRPGRGNFDPAQFRQRMMDRYKEDLQVSNDAEWKVIEARIDKVLEARRDIGFGGFGGRGGRGGRGGGPGGPGGAGGPQADPDVTALREAIDSNAPADQIKAKLAKVQAARKAKEEKLEAAQADLRKVLSVRQEAAAYLAGLLR